MNAVIAERKAMIRKEDESQFLSTNLGSSSTMGKSVSMHQLELMSKAGQKKILMGLVEDKVLKKEWDLQQKQKELEAKEMTNVLANEYNRQMMMQAEEQNRIEALERQNKKELTKAEQKLLREAKIRKKEAERNAMIEEEAKKSQVRQQ